MLIWQLGSVTDHLGKEDFLGITLWANGLDLDGGWWWFYGSSNSLGGEVEGNAEDVGIFHVKATCVWIDGLVLPSEGTTNHLLAQQLGAEGSYTQHKGHRVGIPPPL